MKKKNINPMDLKTVTRWYLLAALIVLFLFQVLLKSESTLSYIGEILSGLITMYGIYYAFADSERTRDIENKPRLSAAVSSVPADDSADRPFTFFAGGHMDLTRHLRFTLHNEGSTEIDIMGLFVGKADHQSDVKWLPYKTYQLSAGTSSAKQSYALLNENLDLNGSLQLPVNVSERNPNGPDTEAPRSKNTKTRFFVEVWYRNDYSDTFYVKKYTVEHIPLERCASVKETVWNQSLDCHASTAQEKTKTDFEQKVREAEQYDQSIAEFIKRKKEQNESSKA